MFKYKNLVTACFARNWPSPGNTAYQEIQRKINANVSASNLNEIPFYEGGMNLKGLYSSNIVRVIKSRRLRWAGHVARMEEGRGVHKVLMGKPKGKRPLGRQRRRWEDNIKMDLEEVGRGCGDWMELAQDRDKWRALVSTVMNFVVP